MRNPPCSSARIDPCLSLLAAALALAPACGDSGSGSATDPTTTSETTTSETAGTTDASTTDAPTTTGSTTGSTTTGDPLVCDGSMPANAFECAACTECGTWTTPLAGSDYPPALACVLAGIRDGVVVGAETQSCEQGKCLVDRMLTTGEGTLISQQMILDQNDQSMQYFSVQALELKEAAYFEACLAAYDVDCTVPNFWFEGASVAVDPLVCP